MLMGRVQYNSGTSSGQNSSTKWLPTGSITSPLGGGYITGYGTSAGQWKSMYMLAQLHYAYKGRYIFDATVRRDGTTKFGKSKRWGNFPGISARWNISDEPFIKEKAPWLSMLSIRPGWGIVGRQPGGEGLFYSKYASGSNYMGESTVVPSNIRLTNLQWEQTQTWNLGFDFGFFQNKLTADLSVYTSKTTELLMSGRAIPSSSGYGSLAWQNVGSMRNVGWEFNINGRQIIKRGPFSVDFNVTFANNRNEVVSMDPTVLESMNAEFGYTNGTYLSRVQLHNPLGAIYGFKYKGVYQYSDYSPEEIKGVSGPNAPVAKNEKGEVILNAAGNPKDMFFDYAGKRYQFVGGDAIYEDVNHDGTIDALDIVYLGSSLPKLTGGFGFKLNYGNWSMNAQFNYRVGNKVVNYARMGLENMSTSNNQSRAVNWRWHTEGDAGANLLPRAFITKTGLDAYNYLGSDRFVEDASFLRLNYLNFAYRVDSKVLKEWGLSQLSFYLTLNNVFKITKYSGADPEIAQAGFAPAGDNSKTPRSKSFTVGATVSF